MRWLVSTVGECGVPSAKFYLRQAELASRLALAATDEAKLAALHLLVLQNLERAEKAKRDEPPPKTE
jgi:hypothetical protein